MKLSKLVTRQIPAFIREEHPVFVKFIQKYYEFVEQQGFLDKDLSTNSQIQSLIDAITNEVAYSLPKTISDETFFLQRIRDVYLTKGSEESFKFLFRLLFNREIEFFYPSSVVLKTSDGEWMQDYSIFVRTIVGNPFATIKNNIDVISSESNVSLSIIKAEERTSLEYIFEELDLGFVRETVKSIINLGYTLEPVETILDVGFTKSIYKDTVLEIFIDRDFYGKFKEDDIVVTSDREGGIFVGYIISTTAKTKIYNRGIGFRPGHLMPIKTPTGGIGTVLKVSSISTNGSIETVDFLKFGYEYPRPIVVSATPDGKIKLMIEERAEYDDDPNFNTNINIEDFTSGTISRGYGLDNFDYVFDSDAVINYQMTNFGSNYTNAQVTFTTNTLGDTAQGNAVINYNIEKELTGLIICNLDYDLVTPKNVVNGVGTLFLSEVSIGKVLRCPSGILGKVASIQSNTQLTLIDIPTVSTNRSIGQVVSGYISDIEILRGGNFYSSTPSITITGDGTGATAEALMGKDIYWDLDYCGDIKTRFAYNRVVRIPTDEEKALIRLYPGPVAKYPGYYVDNRGFSSDSIYLQDGRYYQNFSYVIKSDIPMEKYEAYMKTTVHPAGKIMFGEYEINNNLSIDNDVNIQVLKTRYLTVNLSDQTDPIIDTQSFVNVVYSHVKTVVDSLSATDYGNTTNNPYSAPKSYLSDKLWIDYTATDIAKDFDSN